MSVPPHVRDHITLCISSPGRASERERVTHTHLVEREREMHTHLAEKERARDGERERDRHLEVAIAESAGDHERAAHALDRLAPHPAHLQIQDSHGRII